MRQQLFQVAPKFPSAHYTIPDIGQEWIPKKEKELSQHVLIFAQLL